MATNINYYGGKKIEDPKILNEIADIENGTESDVSDILKINGVIKCSFSNSTTDIYLGEQLGATGGEGAVFKTSIDGLVAKIYLPKMRTALRKEKLNLMVNNQIEDKAICWPKGILTYQDKFVGIVMPLIDHDVYEIIDPDIGHEEVSQFLKNDRRNALKILINVMEIFEKLKANNIVMGDINFNNFMINKLNFEVILIDLDGAQIDKFPCVTCKERFNAPELFKNVIDSEENEEHVANNYYHQMYSTFLRDRYGLAAYSFMLLMCVKPFNDILCLSRNEFGYDLTDERITIDNRKAYQYSYRWAHFPFFVREAFHKCFTTKNPNDRLTPEQWKSVFKYYLDLLNGESLSSLDADCLVLYDLKAIDYSVLKNVKMILTARINSTAFTMKDAVKRLSSDLKKNDIIDSIDVKLVSEYLKTKRVFKTERFTFKLLFNIGVLIKVSLEYKKFTK